MVCHFHKQMATSTFHLCMQANPPVSIFGRFSLVPLQAGSLSDPLLDPFSLVLPHAGHPFCAECICKWRQRSWRCPVCRVMDNRELSVASIVQRRHGSIAQVPLRGPDFCNCAVALSASPSDGGAPVHVHIVSVLCICSFNLLMVWDSHLETLQQPSLGAQCGELLHMHRNYRLRQK
jgi:hypothetical protein